MSNKIDQAIQEEIDNLKSERESLLGSVSGLESERVDLENKMNKAQKSYYDKVAEIKAVTHPRLYDIDVEIGSLTKKLSTNRTFPVV